MNVVLNCPSCGKRYELADSLAGKKARCSGCRAVFRVLLTSEQADKPRDPAVPGSPEKLLPAETSRPRKSRAGQPERTDTKQPVPDLWDDVVPAEVDIQRLPRLTAIRRGRSRGHGGGLPTGVLLGLGAVGLTVLGVVLVVVYLGPAGSDNRRPDAHERSNDQAESSSVTERIRSVGDFPPDPKDLSRYPALGALPPSLLAPPPLRDLSQVEQVLRAGIVSWHRHADILATVHDVPSLKAMREPWEAEQSRLRGFARRDQRFFSLTEEEKLELARRVADDYRNSVAHFRAEARRIIAIPGTGQVGSQLLAEFNKSTGAFERYVDQVNGLAPRSAPKPFAEIFVVDLKSADAARVIKQKLMSLVGGEADLQSSFQADLQAASYRVWPVKDVNLLASRIAFGKATVQGRRIFVMAGPISADEITAAKAGENK